MKITVDTNVLVRAAVRDNEQQAREADKVLRTSELVAVSLPCLCEFVWVLGRIYRLDHAEIARSIELLCNAPNVEFNRAAVAAGIALLKAGGDFADGVIAYEGSWMGGDIFVSFDKHAVSLLAKQGNRTKLLG